METTRRGFFKFLGLAAPAAAVTVAVLPKATETYELTEYAMGFTTDDIDAALPNHTHGCMAHLPDGSLSPHTHCTCHWSLPADTLYTGEQFKRSFNAVLRQQGCKIG